MATAQPWWVIAITQYGSPPQYVYFQGTQAQADAKAKLYVEVSTAPAVSGPYPTKAKAEEAVKAGKVNTPNLPGGYQQSGISVPGLSQIGTFFGSLGEASTWIRVGEVVLGLILLAVGVARITRAVPIATQVARTAGAAI